MFINFFEFVVAISFINAGHVGLSHNAEPLRAVEAEFRDFPLSDSGFAQNLVGTASVEREDVSSSVADHHKIFVLRLRRPLDGS